MCYNFLNFLLLHSYGTLKLVVKQYSIPFGSKATFFANLYSESIAAPRMTRVRIPDGAIFRAMSLCSPLVWKHIKYLFWNIFIFFKRKKPNLGLIGFKMYNMPSQTSTSLLHKVAIIPEWERLTVDELYACLKVIFRNFSSMSLDR